MFKMYVNVVRLWLNSYLCQIYYFDCRILSKKSCIQYSLLHIYRISIFFFWHLTLPRACRLNIRRAYVIRCGLFVFFVVCVHVLQFCMCFCLFFCISQVIYRQRCDKNVMLSFAVFLRSYIVLYRLTVIVFVLWT